MNCSRTTADGLSIQLQLLKTVKTNEIEVTTKVMQQLHRHERLQ